MHFPFHNSVARLMETMMVAKLTDDVAVEISTAELQMTKVEMLRVLNVIVRIAVVWLFMIIN